MLFHRDIDGWASWGRVFQDIPAFAPLVHAIFETHGLPAPRSITPLPPGTNAVFRADDTVVKIYAPPQSGCDMHEDYQTELYALDMAGRFGVPAPRALFHGTLCDRYRFDYLVQSYLPGPSAADAFPLLSRAEKDRLADRAGQILSKIHRIPPRAEPRYFKTLAGNERWRRRASPAFHEKVLLAARQIPPEPVLFVHGDLTGDNLLLPPGGPCVLDFADSQSAPLLYEYPPLFFDLFRFDLPSSEQASGLSGSRLALAAYQAVLLHDFGADFSQLLAKRYLGKDLSALCDPEQILDAARLWAHGA